MLVRANDRLSEINLRFQDVFPGLKLNFYKHKHSDHEGSPKADTYEASLLIKDLSSVESEVNLNLDPSQSVSDLENLFEKEFGLHVQVFRRSNDLWLQTTTTDDWSLEKQNRKGIHSIQS